MLQLPPSPIHVARRRRCRRQQARPHLGRCLLPARRSRRPKDHIALGRSLGILDFERGVKLAGSRSHVIRGAGAQLYWAVLRFAQDTLARRGYEPFVVPVLVGEPCMIGTGYFPAGRRPGLYHPRTTPSWSAPARSPLASFHRRRDPRDEADLPKLSALSAASAAKPAPPAEDTAGLLPRPPVRQGRAGRDPQGRRAGAHRASRGDHRQRRERSCRL